MSNLNFTSPTELIDHIEELFKVGISEFIKNDESEFIFKVSGYWYKINYQNDFGYKLVLYQSIHRGSIDNEICKIDCTLRPQSNNRSIANKFWKELGEKYYDFIISRNEKYILLFYQYLELIKQCEHIDRKDNNLFVLTIKGKKLHFTRRDSKEDVICRIAIEDENAIELKNEYAYYIFSLLNSIYYLYSLPQNDPDILKEVLKLIKD